LPLVLTFYLAALIFGLGLFAVQLFGSAGAGPHDAALPGGDGGAGFGHLGGGHLASGHLGGEQASEGFLDPGHAIERAPVATEGPHDVSWATIFLSLRFYMFAAIGLGAVGAPVTALDLSTPGLTFGVALSTAFGVGVLASLAFRLLGRDTLSSGATGEELVGHVGRVLVACEKGRKGKVRLTVRGQTIDFVATTDEPRLEPGAGVIVQDVHSERVHVCAAPPELLPD